VATIQELIDIVGTPFDSDAVQTIIAASEMVVSTHPNGEGRSPHVYLSAHKEGYSLLHCDGKVRTIFVYVLPICNFTPFQGCLPGDLPTSATRSQVLQQFGVPSRTGSAAPVPILGRMGAWDRFDGDRVCIHFEYTEPDERVQMVTIMNAATAP
jgi:hypothetical protein